VKQEFIHIWNWNPFNVFEFNLKIGNQFNSIKSKFNFNSIFGLKFNWIQWKTNCMQIGGECIEYLFVNTVLAKKTSKRHKYEKTQIWKDTSIIIIIELSQEIKKNGYFYNDGIIHP
jgi:hypothetical protein